MAQVKFWWAFRSDLLHSLSCAGVEHHDPSGNDAQLSFWDVKILGGNNCWRQIPCEYEHRNPVCHSHTTPRTIFFHTKKTAHFFLYFWPYELESWVMEGFLLKHLDVEQLDSQLTECLRNAKQIQQASSWGRSFFFSPKTGWCLGRMSRSRNPLNPPQKDHLKIAGIAKDVSFWDGGIEYITPFSDLGTDVSRRKS